MAMCVQTLPKYVNCVAVSNREPKIYFDGKMCIQLPVASSFNVHYWAIVSSRKVFAISSEVGVSNFLTVLLHGTAPRKCQY